MEATMSEYDRRTGAKRLRVRGLKAVRFSATLKALGINLLRAAAAYMAAKEAPDDSSEAGKGLNHVFSIVKEHFFVTCRSLKVWLRSLAASYKQMLIKSSF